MNKLLNMFDKPKIIGLVANINEGKSNLLYYIITQLIKEGNKNIVSFGLRLSCGEHKIYSLNELEDCKNKIVFLDEMMTLFDLDNRMAKRQIENTLRLIVHNNNILVLCGLPENFKKFLCGKINEWIFKKVTIEDFIRGSGAKKVVVNYRGCERGSELLSIEKGEALIFSQSYFRVNIPYLAEFDTKAGNKPLRVRHNNCQPKKVSVNVSVNRSVNELAYQNVSQDNVQKLKQNNIKEI